MFFSIYYSKAVGFHIAQNGPAYIPVMKLSAGGTVLWSGRKILANAPITLSMKLSSPRQFIAKPPHIHWYWLVLWIIYNSNAKKGIRVWWLILILSSDLILTSGYAWFSECFSGKTFNAPIDPWRIEKPQ